MRNDNHDSLLQKLEILLCDEKNESNILRLCSRLLDTCCPSLQSEQAIGFRSLVEEQAILLLLKVSKNLFKGDKREFFLHRVMKYIINVMDDPRTWENDFTGFDFIKSAICLTLQYSDYSSDHSLIGSSLVNLLNDLCDKTAASCESNHVNILLCLFDSICCSLEYCNWATYAIDIVISADLIIRSLVALDNTDRFFGVILSAISACGAMLKGIAAMPSSIEAADEAALVHRVSMLADLVSSISGTRAGAKGAHDIVTKALEIMISNAQSYSALKNVAFKNGLYLLQNVGAELEVDRIESNTDSAMDVNVDAIIGNAELIARALWLSTIDDSREKVPSPSMQSSTQIGPLMSQPMPSQRISGEAVELTQAVIADTIVASYTTTVLSTPHSDAVTADDIVVPVAPPATVDSSSQALIEAVDTNDEQQQESIVTMQSCDANIIGATTANVLVNSTADSVSNALPLLEKPVSTDDESGSFSWEVSDDSTEHEGNQPIVSAGRESSNISTSRPDNIHPSAASDVDSDDDTATVASINLNPSTVNAAVIDISNIVPKAVLEADSDDDTATVASITLNSSTLNAAVIDISNIVPKAVLEADSDDDTATVASITLNSSTLNAAVIDISNIVPKAVLEADSDDDTATVASINLNSGTLNHVAIKTDPSHPESCTTTLSPEQAADRAYSGEILPGVGTTPPDSIHIHVPPNIDVMVTTDTVTDAVPSTTEGGKVERSALVVATDTEITALQNEMEPTEADNSTRVSITDADIVTDAGINASDNAVIDNATDTVIYNATAAVIDNAKDTVAAAGGGKVQGADSDTLTKGLVDLRRVVANITLRTVLQDSIFDTAHSALQKSKALIQVSPRSAVTPRPSDEIGSISVFLFSVSTSSKLNQLVSLLSSLLKEEVQNREGLRDSDSSITDWLINECAQRVTSLLEQGRAGAAVRVLEFLGGLTFSVCAPIRPRDSLNPYYSSPDITSDARKNFIAVSKVAFEKLKCVLTSIISRYSTTADSSAARSVLTAVAATQLARVASLDRSLFTEASDVFTSLFKATIINVKTGFPDNKTPSVQRLADVRVKLGTLDGLAFGLEALVWASLSSGFSSAELLQSLRRKFAALFCDVFDAVYVPTPPVDRGAVSDHSEKAKMRKSEPKGIDTDSDASTSPTGNPSYSTAVGVGSLFKPLAAVFVAANRTPVNFTSVRAPASQSLSRLGPQSASSLGSSQHSRIIALDDVLLENALSHETSSLVSASAPTVTQEDISNEHLRVWLRITIFRVVEIGPWRSNTGDWLSSVQTIAHCTPALIRLSSSPMPTSFTDLMPAGLSLANEIVNKRMSAIASFDAKALKLKPDEAFYCLSVQFKESVAAAGFLDVRVLADYIDEGNSRIAQSLRPALRLVASHVFRVWIEAGISRELLGRERRYRSLSSEASGKSYSDRYLEFAASTDGVVTRRIIQTFEYYLSRCLHKDAALQGKAREFVGLCLDRFSWLRKEKSSLQLLFRSLEAFTNSSQLELSIDNFYSGDSATLPLSSFYIQELEEWASNRDSEILPRGLMASTSTPGRALEATAEAAFELAYSWLYAALRETASSPSPISHVLQQILLEEQEKATPPSTAPVASHPIQSQSIGQSIIVEVLSSENTSAMPVFHELVASKSSSGFNNTSSPDVYVLQRRRAATCVVKILKTQEPIQKVRSSYTLSVAEIQAALASFARVLQSYNSRISSPVQAWTQLCSEIIAAGSRVKISDLECDGEGEGSMTSVVRFLWRCGCAVFELLRAPLVDVVAGTSPFPSLAAVARSFASNLVRTIGSVTSAHLQNPRLTKESVSVLTWLYFSCSSGSHGGAGAILMKAIQREATFMLSRSAQYGQGIFHTQGRIRIEADGGVNVVELDGSIAGSYSGVDGDIMSMSSTDNLNVETETTSQLYLLEFLTLLLQDNRAAASLCIVRLFEGIAPRLCVAGSSGYTGAQITTRVTFAFLSLGLQAVDHLARITRSRTTFAMLSRRRVVRELLLRAAVEWFNYGGHSARLTTATSQCTIADFDEFRNFYQYLCDNKNTWIGDDELSVTAMAKSRLLTNSDHRPGVGSAGAFEYMSHLTGIRTGVDHDASLSHVVPIDVLHNHASTAGLNGFLLLLNSSLLWEMDFLLARISSEETQRALWLESEMKNTFRSDEAAHRTLCAHTATTLGAHKLAARLFRSRGLDGALLRLIANVSPRSLSPGKISSALLYCPPCPVYSCLSLLSALDPLISFAFGEEDVIDHPTLSLYSTAGFGTVHISAETWFASLRLVIRSLRITSTKELRFYVPQLVQSLRWFDGEGALSSCLRNAALDCASFCHTLMHALHTERDAVAVAYGVPTSSVATATSGWAFGYCNLRRGPDPLQARLQMLMHNITSSLDSQARSYLWQQLGYFESLIDVSCLLRDMKDKNARPGAFKKALEALRGTLADVTTRYPVCIPFRSFQQVLSFGIADAMLLKSAAKCPFLLQFQTCVWQGPDFAHSEEKNSGDNLVHQSPKGASLLSTEKCESPLSRESPLNRAAGFNKNSTSAMNASLKPKSLTAILSDAHAEDKEVVPSPFIVSAAAASADATSTDAAGFKATTGPATTSLNVSCIFKAYDDCRQDAMTLQIVSILQNAFERAGLPLQLTPYAVIATRASNGALGGIIEVIPGVQSRHQLAAAGAKRLLQHFKKRFGAPGSAAFEAALSHFVNSLAAYAVLCYLLKLKDRHNGNILIDSSGRIIHIDYSFLLGTSPGGNMGFETAAFKLNSEMIELMGGLRSSTFASFVQRVLAGYLVARQVMEPIMAVVTGYVDGGLACFSQQHGGSRAESIIYKLRKRFAMHLSDCAAAARMRRKILESSKKWTTGAYDLVQKIQNHIQ